MISRCSLLRCGLKPGFGSSRRESLAPLNEVQKVMRSCIPWQSITKCKRKPILPNTLRRGGIPYAKPYWQLFHLIFICRRLSALLPFRLFGDSVERIQMVDAFVPIGFLKLSLGICGAEAFAILQEQLWSNLQERFHSVVPLFLGWFCLC